VKSRSYFTRINLWRARIAGAFVCAWFLILLPAVSVSTTDSAAKPLVAAAQERHLFSALESWRAGDLLTAVNKLEELLADQPNFHLAQLLYSDLLRIQAGHQSLLSKPLSTQKIAQPQAYSLADLVSEARLRWQRYSNGPPPGYLPASLLKLADTQRHAIVVDLAKARTYVFENQRGQAKLIGDYYSGIGKAGPDKMQEGDHRTPVGVYFVIERLTDAELPELYGHAAYPLNYPNTWDLGQQRTGSGIWIHGVPRANYSRAPLSSRGCVTMANQDLQQIEKIITVGRTPVILSNGIHWVKPVELKQDLSEFWDTFEQWRIDWESRDTDRYLSHYADDFDYKGLNKTKWAKHKRRVNAHKRFIKVQIFDLSVLRYPHSEQGGAVMVVDFKQNYQSDNYALVSRKRQYWVRGTDGRWQIRYEMSIKHPVADAEPATVANK